MFRKTFSSLVYKLNSTVTFQKGSQPLTNLINLQCLNIERSISVSSLKFGTNPGQRSQKIAAGQKKGNQISKLVTKLRGAMRCKSYLNITNNLSLFCQVSINNQNTTLKYLMALCYKIVW